MIKNIKLFIFTLIVVFGFGIANVSALVSGDFSYVVNSDGTTVTIDGYSDAGLKDVVIPNIIDGKPVITIGQNAFRYKQLTSVTIPDSVTSIGNSAFLVNQLTSVTIPSSVKTIGVSAFQSNIISNLTIQEGVEELGTGAFTRNQLTSIILPSSIKKIGAVAFTWNKLETVVVQKGVETIGELAFDYQSNDGMSGTKILKKIYILDKNTVISNKQFENGFNSDFKYYGYAGSTTEAYANSKNYGFYALSELTESMITEIPTQYFTGTALKPAITITDGATTLTEGVDYTTTYSNNDAVGTGKVIITGLGNYFGSVIEKTFAIKKKQYTVRFNPLTGVTVTPNTTLNVDYDGSQNYTIIANSGYKITSVLVNGVENINSLVGNVLTISNPTSDMTIVVKTERVVEPVIPITEENPSTGDSVLLYISLGLISLIVLTGKSLYVKKSNIY